MFFFMSLRMVAKKRTIHTFHLAFLFLTIYVNYFFGMRHGYQPPHTRAKCRKCLVIICQKSNVILRTKVQLTIVAAAELDSRLLHPP